MQFWIRHFLLLALCVVLPFSAALYFDTAREVDRATASGLARVRTAIQNLKNQLRLHAHERQAQVVSLAAEIEDRNLLRSLTRSGSRGEANFIQLRELLDQAAGRNGFAWYADPDGRVLVENGLNSLPEQPKLITAHPIFVETQHGYALDGAWSDEGDLTWVYAAPVAREGVASGAVLVGKKLEEAEAQALATGISGAVTLVHHEEVQATTLPRPTAGEIRLATSETAEAVAAGRLDEPLPSTTRLPFLPVFFDPHAEGVAFASVAIPVRGAATARWVVSVNATDGLEQVGARQEILLGAMFASLLLAILVGLMNSRTFVRPIDTLEAHLSQIQLGRGDWELPERRVSGPFRRLVRLINMTVQKMPARALTPLSGDTVSTASPARPPVSRPSPVESEGRSPLPSLATPGLPPALADLDPDTEAGVPEAPAALMRSDTALPMPTPRPTPIPTPIPTPTPSSFPVSVDLPPSSEVESNTPLPLPTQDESDAIAEAIASLEHQLSGTPTPIQPRRADEIRGGIPKPYTIEEIEASTEGQVPGGVRTGGSLELGNAGLPAEEDPREDDDFKAEATVVAPVQEDLLAKSARDDLTDTHAMREISTAVTSVPADLLARSSVGVEVLSPSGVGDGPYGAPEYEAPEREAPEYGPPEYEAPEYEVPETGGLDAADQAHFKDVYDRFIEMRKQCGETTQDLVFDRFLAKLTRNRETLVKKYACRTVRFQVYEKDGRAALKATPVRAR